MPGLISLCEKYFNTSDLYKVLKVGSDASESSLRKAYHRISLLVHPDRVEEGDKKETTEKFKVVGKVYALLSDSEKRKIYDESGEVDDESDVIQERDWEAYWRVLFPKITLDDIRNFEKKYKGSEEEKEDLKDAYEVAKGDMDEIMERVLCVTIEDEPRLTQMLKDLIKSKDLPAYDAFVKESKKKKQARKRRFVDEAKEAEEMAAEMGVGGDENALVQAIKRRQQSRENEANAFFDHLLSKYGGDEKKTSKKANPTKSGGSASRGKKKLR